METNRFGDNDAASIPASGLIYALQTKPPSLLEFAPDGTNVKTLIADLGGRPDGVQVDATRGLIYFSIMGKPRLIGASEDFSAADGAIECCNLDGSNRLSAGPFVSSIWIKADMTRSYFITVV